MPLRARRGLPVRRCGSDTLPPELCDGRLSTPKKTAGGLRSQAREPPTAYSQKIAPGTRFPMIQTITLSDSSTFARRDPGSTGIPLDSCMHGSEEFFTAGASEAGKEWRGMEIEFLIGVLSRYSGHHGRSHKTMAPPSGLPCRTILLRFEKFCANDVGGIGIASRTVRAQLRMVPGAIPARSR